MKRACKRSCKYGETAQISSHHSQRKAAMGFTRLRRGG
jgi:hypothetical protein